MPTIPCKERSLPLTTMKITTKLQWGESDKSRGVRSRAYNQDYSLYYIMYIQCIHTYIHSYEERVNSEAADLSGGWSRWKKEEEKEITSIILTIHTNHTCIWQSHSCDVCVCMVESTFDEWKEKKPSFSFCSSSQGEHFWNSSFFVCFFAHLICVNKKTLNLLF